MRTSFVGWSSTLVPIAAFSLAFAATFSPAQAHAETTIRVAANGPVGTLDPARQRLGSLEYNFDALVFDRLTSFDADLNIIPGLAESWDVSPDQKVWTFHLRKGVKFHNDRELDADDVLATFKRLQDPANASLIRGSLGILDKMEAADKHTVRFTLKIPYSAWSAITSNFAASIVPRDGADTLATRPIGSGPYKFVDYAPERGMTLLRNPDYFDPGIAKIDKVDFKIIPDYNTAVAALDRGELELLGPLPPEYIDKVSKSRVAHVAEVTTGSWQTYIMNNSMAPFDNPKVRQAFVKIVDRAEVADIAMFGHAKPTITPIPPGHPFYDGDIAIAKADPEGAKRLLAEAGYPNGLTIGLWTPARQPVRERIAVAFRDLAKKANVTVEVHTVPEDQYVPSHFQFATGSFSARPTPDMALYDWYHSTGSWNHTMWLYKNVEVDKVLDAARQTSDSAQQKQLYTRFQELVTADDPGPVVFVTNNAVGISNKVRGFTPSKLSIIDLRNVTLAN
jgi:peptide/nickel transport system substrate-binding protein